MAGQPAYRYRQLGMHLAWIHGHSKPAGQLFRFLGFSDASAVGDEANGHLPGSIGMQLRMAGSKVLGTAGRSVG